MSLSDSISWINVNLKNEIHNSKRWHKMWKIGHGKKYVDLILIYLVTLLHNIKKIYSRRTRINPAFAVANCVKIHSSTFGPQIPTRSPFLRPRARNPEASLSAWEYSKKHQKNAWVYRFLALLPYLVLCYVLTFRFSSQLKLRINETPTSVMFYAYIQIRCFSGLNL
jgi:hypothetical protein